MSMIPPILRFLFLMALATVLPLSAAPEAAAGFEYGPRPPDAVFDPSGMLDPILAKDLSDSLGKLRQEKGIDVVVVVLKDLGEAPPEHVALQFCKAWCTLPLASVVLHVPGRTDSPWIVPSGKLVEHINKPDDIRNYVDAGERRSRAEPKDGDKVKAAATETRDMLEYWREVYFIGRGKYHTELLKARLELETRSRNLKILALMSAAAFIPIVVGIFYLRAFLKQSGPGYFPNHAWQLRLGAPHAGGNQAVHDLGSPLA